MEEHTQELKFHFLFSKVEATLGQKINTSNDFDYLSKDIEHRTGKSIGVSTLKRIWGYVNDSHTPRLSTLNVLAQYAGFKDWEAFSNNNNTYETESGFVKLRSLNVDNLEPGSIIRLTWQPDRKCVVLFRKDKTFVVIKSEKTRLIPNTTFTCKNLYAGESLLLENVRIGDEGCPGIYQIGKINGIQFDIISGE